MHGQLSRSPQGLICLSKQCEQAAPLQVTLDAANTTCIAGINATASLPPAAAPSGALVFGGPVGTSLQLQVQLQLCDGTLVADAVLAGYPLASLLTWQSSTVRSFPHTEISRRGRARGDWGELRKACRANLHAAPQWTGCRHMPS